MASKGLKSPWEPKLVTTTFIYSLLQGARWLEISAPSIFFLRAARLRAGISPLQIPLRIQLIIETHETGLQHRAALDSIHRSACAAASPRVAPSDRVRQWPAPRKLRRNEVESVA